MGLASTRSRVGLAAAATLGVLGAISVPLVGFGSASSGGAQLTPLVTLDVAQQMLVNAEREPVEGTLARATSASVGNEVMSVFTYRPMATGGEGVEVLLTRGETAWGIGGCEPEAPGRVSRCLVGLEGPRSALVVTGLVPEGAERVEVGYRQRSALVAQADGGAFVAALPGADALNRVNELPSEVVALDADDTVLARGGDLGLPDLLERREASLAP